ncbi:Molybdenum cofactor sulfurase [Penicillium macrosclerotiorum]|uniref:Molybdenum cofactor sulfurase n=1 Tax=Penicillium macrosclerotiorum TaxID=303699 RepID=UPI00254811BA|nr:Molybdenum cofactor sulfurase [Penicillium macrosclerotiorum]KAJ5669160.1 Molybdenum cofactor sulfurase [Penicillium macrosclerotiorum]
MTSPVNGERPWAEYGRGYSDDVDKIREQEYPLLNALMASLETTYVDHAGTTPYAKSMIEAFSRHMTSNLFGNPHSMSLSSQLSTQRTDDIRLRVLRFFNADPTEFDLVFVANATAAIKLVADSFRDSDYRGFWYGYHIDAHTSLVGVRELADMGHQCFQSDAEVESWIPELASTPTKAPRLFAFPAQSNMNGRRLPLRWCEKIRSAAETCSGNVYTLLDAASFVSTAPLDLGPSGCAPDFTALSFYKIFGFPDLGALIVRKSAARVFERRKFFGGGTVDMVIAAGAQWHAKKETSIHERLEDGTLPFHSIIALDAALDTHERLYGSMANISSHTGFLAKRLYDRLSVLTHWNQTNVCQIYQNNSVYGCPLTQGPIIAFNLRNSKGEWIPKTEVEKLATVQNLQLRSGSVCNPGGTAHSLGWTGADLRRHYSTGLRCGDAHDILSGRPTGILRVSLGAMTNMKDIDSVVDFIEEFYVEKIPPIVALNPPLEEHDIVGRHFYIESLSVFPIKSCGAFKIPEGKRWEVKREGLAWDREWCLIHQGTGTALNQKRYPRMALIRPAIDLDRGVLRITCGVLTEQVSLEISLGWEDMSLVSTSLCPSSKRTSTVCGDQISLHAYASPVVSAFFSDFLGVPCTLARFPTQTTNRYSRPPRISNRWKSKFRKFIMPGSFPPDLPPPVRESGQNPLLLSNEMPILVVSRSSVNRLNETIKASTKYGAGSKAVAADVFRGNIVVAERLAQLGDSEQPYAEDHWAEIRIGPDQLRIDMLDACQRCQMVCIDQFTGLRRDEPFSTLAKTRNIKGKVSFGRYSALSSEETEGLDSTPDRRTVMVGDVVMPSYDDA